VPPGAVPLADAAALEAREAAASCDAALNPVDADEDFVHKMRGWLMTVATPLLGKPLSMGPLSVEHYILVLHR
jgi:hypothetical protein